MYKGEKCGLRKDEVKAFELFNRAADLGFVEAIGQLGAWAMDGLPGMIPDRAKAKEYFEDAAAKGDILSRNNLAVLLADVYYIGYLSAKELKKVINVHRAGDFSAVKTLLSNKIRAADSTQM